MDSSNEKRQTNISKKMSYFLRHHLDKISSSVTSDGYVKLNSLLSMKDFSDDNIEEEEIEHIVTNNDKQRFKIIITDTGEKLIRANQGHSTSKVTEVINPTKIFTKITEPFEYCVHGTTRKAIDEIKKNGLNKMSRTHIHFASSPDAISGFRTSSKVLVHINMEQAMLDGIKFYLSENNVILSEGPIDSKYFSKIEFV